MPDSAAKTFYVITLRGDRGPYSRADLGEALQSGEVSGGDQARNAFGRPLGTVAHVLHGPTSDRALAAIPAPRPPPATRRSRPWLAPAMIGGALLALVGGMMALRGGGPQSTAHATIASPLAASAPAAPTAEVQQPRQPTAPTTVPASARPEQQARQATPLDRLPTLPEARGFRLVCDLDLRRLGARFKYRVDHREASRVPFDRIAYLVETSTITEPDRFVWVAMDPFTSDPGRIALPTVASKAFFQTAVRNLQVRSNVPGVPVGDHGAGNIEFWPCDYSEAASASVTGASSTRFDASDTPRLNKDGSAGEGHGCMQVHLAPSLHTLFAINRWREGTKADIGIGTCTGKHPDWTFAANAASLTAGRLRVLIRPR